MQSILKPSTVRVAQANPVAVDRYKEMRGAVMSISEEDRTTSEIVITCQLALLGQEAAFKFHVIRLLQLNVAKERLEQFILAGLGVTLILPQAARALDWIEDAHRDFMAPTSDQP